MDKKELRKYIRELKKKYTQEERRLLSLEVWKKLEQDKHFQQAKIILAYWSLEDELYTHDFIKRWSREKIFLLPCVKGGELELRYFDGEERLCPGEGYAIPEPVGEVFTDFDRIDLILVPGMAFDEAGNRLGHGKGYYDKILQNCKAYKIGVCFAFQFVEEVPTEPHDIRMDAVMK